MHGLTKLPGQTWAGIFKQRDSYFARPCMYYSTVFGKKHLIKFDISLLQWVEGFSSIILEGEVVFNNIDQLKLDKCANETVGLHG